MARLAKEELRSKYIPSPLEAFLLGKTFRYLLVRAYEEVRAGCMSTFLYRTQKFRHTTSVIILLVLQAINITAHCPFFLFSLARQLGVCVRERRYNYGYMWNAEEFKGAGIFMIAIRRDILTMPIEGAQQHNGNLRSLQHCSLARPLFQELWRFVSYETQYPYCSVKRLVALHLRSEEMFLSRYWRREIIKSSTRPSSPHNHPKSRP